MLGFWTLGEDALGAFGETGVTNSVTGQLGLTVGLSSVNSLTVASTGFALTVSLTSTCVFIVQVPVVLELTVECTSSEGFGRLYTEAGTLAFELGIENTSTQIAPFWAQPESVSGNWVKETSA